jgi:intracellular septation protein A
MFRPFVLNFVSYPPPCRSVAKYQELLVSASKQAGSTAGVFSPCTNFCNRTAVLVVTRVCVCVCVYLSSIHISKHQLKMVVGVIVFGEIPGSQISECLPCYALSCVYVVYTCSKISEISGACTWGCTG